MTLLAFVLFWVILGTSLVFIALSGGPRGARQRLHSQSRAGRKVAYAAFAAGLLGMGFAVPALVIAAVQNRDDVPEANVSNLTERQKEGRQLFGENCRICHALQAAQATALVGPDLDNLRPPKALTLDAIEKGRARGNGQMAGNLLQGEDAEKVAEFVAVAVGQKP
jgi:mono/diheme cytochrome c family protein